jgi:opacity protein-like surface antigen
MATLGGSVIASAVIVGSVLAAMPALADGGRAPPEQFPSIWRGAYFGVHVGHGESGPADGLVAGGQVGYNWQSGHIVYGLEADVSFADISFKENFMGSTVKGSIDWMATARGRVGYLLTPGILAYGTLGFGIVSGSGSANLPGVKFSVSDKRLGLRARPRCGSQDQRDDVGPRRISEVQRQRHRRRPGRPEHPVRQLTSRDKLSWTRIHRWPCLRGAFGSLAFQEPKGERDGRQRHQRDDNDREGDPE